MVAYHIFTEKIKIPKEMKTGVESIIKEHTDAFLQTVFDFDEDILEYMDLSEESISILDEIIDVWSGEDGPSEDGRILFFKVFGGYIASIMQKHFNGRWWHDGSEAVFLLYNGKVQTGIGLTPYSYVVRRLDGDETFAEQWEDQEPLVDKSRLKIQT